MTVQPQGKWYSSEKPMAGENATAWCVRYFLAFAPAWLLVRDV